MTVIYTCDVCGKESGNDVGFRVQAAPKGIIHGDMCVECYETVAVAEETAIRELFAKMRFHDSREYDFRHWEKVQLAGPMTDCDDWNRAAFAEARDELAKVYKHGGLESLVFNPAMDAPKGDDTHTHAHWMLKSLHNLTGNDSYVYVHDFRPRVHTLVLLPGWERSEGAVAEAIVAHECGIDLVLWRGLGDGE